MNEEEKHDHQAELPESASGEAEGPGRDDIGHKALADALRVSFKFLKIGMLILAVVYIMQGWFYVPRDRVAIKLSFGRPVESRLGGGRGRGYVLDSESGWHFAWPWQEVLWLSLEQHVLNLEEDFARGGRAGQAGQSQPTERLELHRDNYLLTGDVNIIHMSLRGRYRVRSDQQGAFDYAFAFLSPEEVLRRKIIKATTETISNWDVLEVRRKRRVVQRKTEDGPVQMRLTLFDEIERKVRESMRKFEENNGFSLGLELIAIEPIEDPEVPEEVRPYFDMALDAESKKDTKIQEGRRQATDIVQSATGDRAEILGEAEAYKTRISSSAEADAEMLSKLLPVYMHSPERASILKEWHYSRMIDDLLGPSEGSFILHGASEAGGRELWLELAPQRRTRDRRDND